MASCKITTIGFYNYMKSMGDDLFANLRLPSQLDRETVINTILMDVGELEVVYSDPNFMKQMIGTWSKKNELVIKRWLEGILKDYDPINNYDRYEDLHYTPTGKVMDVSDGKNTPGVTTTNTSTGETAAYDSDDYSNQNRNISTTSQSGADVAHNTNTRSYADYDEHHNNHTYGNIGVATSSSILKEYLQVQSWNIFDHIADLFAEDFCISIYV